jgi:hypothetical protein
MGIKCCEIHRASTARALSQFSRKEKCYKAYVSSEILISERPSKATVYNGRSMEGLFVESVAMCGN